MANEKSWQPCVWIRWKAGAPSSVWETWQSDDKIKSAWNTQGDWDCCFWLNVTTPDELEEFVWSSIRKNEWVDSTKTTWWKQWW
jgi:hypothetical protein